MRSQIQCMQQRAPGNSSILFSPTFSSKLHTRPRSRMRSQNSSILSEDQSSSSATYACCGHTGEGCMELVVTVGGWWLVVGDGETSSLARHCTAHRYSTQRQCEAKMVVVHNVEAAAAAATSPCRPTCGGGFSFRPAGATHAGFIGSGSGCRAGTGSPYGRQTVPDLGAGVL